MLPSPVRADTSKVNYGLGGTTINDARRPLFSRVLRLIVVAYSPRHTSPGKHRHRGLRRAMAESRVRHEPGPRTSHGGCRTVVKRRLQTSGLTLNSRAADARPTGLGVNLQMTVSATKPTCIRASGVGSGDSRAPPAEAQRAGLHATGAASGARRRNGGSRTSHLVKIRGDDTTVAARRQLHADLAMQAGHCRTTGRRRVGSQQYPNVPMAAGGLGRAPSMGRWAACCSTVFASPNATRAVCGTGRSSHGESRDFPDSTIFPAREFSERPGHLFLSGSSARRTRGRNTEPVRTAAFSDRVHARDGSDRAD